MTERGRREVVAGGQQPEQDVLGADVLMVEVAHRRVGLGHRGLGVWREALGPGRGRWRSRGEALVGGLPTDAEGVADAGP